VLGSLYRVKAHLKSADVVLLDDVAESIHKVEAASDVIRRVAHMLHPSSLEQGGLAETLRWYAKAVSGERLNVTTELSHSPIPMSKEGEIVLFRLVQECLNYLVGRPGSARNVAIALDGDPARLRIIVNGTLPMGLRDALTGPGEASNGLAGVRERLRQLRRQTRCDCDRVEIRRRGHALAALVSGGHNPAWPSSSSCVA
jgi:signal transduction histidine kinase